MLKTKVSRDLILFLILIPLFLYGAFYISSRMENQLPMYSVVNKSRQGCSVLFEALKELGYPVSRVMKPVDTYDKGSMQVVAQTAGFDIHSEAVRKWVGDGGVLVYLNPNELYDVEYGVKPKVIGGISIYKYQKGAVLAVDAAMVTNRALMEDTTLAYRLLIEIDQYEYSALCFNETYMFSEINKQSLWDFIPMAYKYIIYQLFLIAAAFFYYKGKRFGKPLPLHEEVERIENEYLYSAASLYRQAGCWDLMLESYYKDFLKQINRTHEDWLDYWEREKLPSADKARRLHVFMGNGKNNAKAKEYIQIVTILEQLKGILKKRRGSHWKTLKRTV